MTFVTPLERAGSPFQNAVWDALLTIPPGETWSYARLARTVGRPQAIRAAGTANGANQFAIVIPCHRVITSNGELGGYGGGLPRKRWLIDHERSCTAHFRYRKGAERRIRSSLRLVVPDLNS
jgi:AraC family transcriptional regulator of adaptative response/methylated-DNA-[protein]-cysteine methyltransferase